MRNVGDALASMVGPTSDFSDETSQRILLLSWRLWDAGVIPEADRQPGLAELQRPKRKRSRAKVYTVGALVFLVISVAGYVGFREYIYGDDAPPVIDLGD